MWLDGTLAGQMQFMTDATGEMLEDSDDQEHQSDSQSLSQKVNLFTVTLTLTIH